MAARPLTTLPPVFVVLGATGAGKTKLGIELARKVDGHVINVDAMQLYKGLPIATNQASEEERQGVPHHMLAILDPLKTRRYTARNFQREALPLMAALREAGTPPVLVGGTLYYLEALLWEFLLQEDTKEQEEEHGEEDAEERGLSNVELHAKLAAQDPAAALRVHPNDRRKVSNALGSLRRSGRPYSARINEQHGVEGRLSGQRRFPAGHVLAFWVDSEQRVLDQRLDRRVNGMLDAGLLDELHAFFANSRTEMKRDRGIWQSIGFKEFLPFLELPEAEQKEEKGKHLLESAIHQLRTSTRQYARRQLQWLRNRVLARPRAHAIAIFRLDSTLPERWDKAVSAPLAQILDFHRRRSGEAPDDGFPDDEAFFEGCPVSPEPLRVSAAFTATERRCETCGGQLFVSEEQWRAHLKSRKHEKRLRALRRREEDQWEAKRRKEKDEEKDEEKDGEKDGEKDEEKDGEN